MSFEYIAQATPEEIARWESKIIRTPELGFSERIERVLTNGRGWTLDSERNCLLTIPSMGSRGELQRYYGFFLENYLIKVRSAFHWDKENNILHFFRFRPWLMRAVCTVAPDSTRPYESCIPDHFKGRVEMVNRYLEEALDAYARLDNDCLKGICHFDESTVDPSWYLKDFDYY